MDRPSILRRWERIPPFSFKKLKGEENEGSLSNSVDEEF